MDAGGQESVKNYVDRMQAGLRRRAGVCSAGSDRVIFWRRARMSWGGGMPGGEIFLVGRRKSGGEIFLKKWEWSEKNRRAHG